MCGTALAPAAEEPRRTRKTVTVVFADVAGATTLGEQVDPESLQDAMRRYFDTAQPIFERHSGSVEKFIGDAVMAPVSRSRPAMPSTSRRGSRVLPRPARF
jgi:class 3 adenylate cyclase